MAWQGRNFIERKNSNSEKKGEIIVKMPLGTYCRQEGARQASSPQAGAGRGTGAVEGGGKRKEGERNHIQGAEGNEREKCQECEAGSWAGSIKLRLGSSEPAGDGPAASWGGQGPPAKEPQLKCPEEPMSGKKIDGFLSSPTPLRVLFIFWSRVFCQHGSEVASRCSVSRQQSRVKCRCCTQATLLLSSMSQGRGPRWLLQAIP